jgi:phenylalanyl-tRNA synthetase beta chain
MKFSENWLRQLVDIKADRDALVHRLTMSGLEVEGIEPIGAALEGIVVAEIVGCEKHPNADKLRVCEVAAGDAKLRIVCGAPNARVGLKAPLAKIGARLPNGVEIKQAALRGVESQGMLCSAKELGIDADASGLMELPNDAPVGESLAKYLGLPDASIELKLTPNRPDCLSVHGLARDVGALFAAPFHPPEITVQPDAIATKRAVALQAGADCPRFVGRVIEGIDLAAKSPLWLIERLRRSGLRSIGAVVDITNYVMIELGQPLHAFDNAKVSGTVAVRRARNGEKLKLLDGSEHALDDRFLVVADDNNAVALGGIMGGWDSRVTEATRDVFFEGRLRSSWAVRASSD